MRWLVPWFLLLLLIVNLNLAGHQWFYTLSLLVQFAFYGVAIAAQFNDGIKEHGIARIIYFFVQVNVAIADASCRFLSGKAHDRLAAIRTVISAAA